jgi:hypothetical protein
MTVELDSDGFERTSAFESFESAAAIAKDLAHDHQTPIFVRYQDGAYWVLAPTWVKRYLDDPLYTGRSRNADRYELDYETGLLYDEDQQREHGAILAESIEYADDVQRSKSEGWFYPDD